jgi:hypothetical protein
MTPDTPKPKATAGVFRAAMLAAQLLMTLALVGSVAIHLVLGSRHFWAFWYLRKYAHAHYHLMQHVAGVCGLCAVALILIWVPLRRRERWSWWALLVAAAFLYGANWLSQLLLGLTDPPLIPNSAQATLGGVFAVGLLLGWRAVSRKGRLG